MERYLCFQNLPQSNFTSLLKQIFKYLLLFSGNHTDDLFFSCGRTFYDFKEFLKIGQNKRALVFELLVYFVVFLIYFPPHFSSTFSYDGLKTYLSTEIVNLLLGSFKMFYILQWLQVTSLLSGPYLQPWFFFSLLFPVPYILILLYLAHSLLV